MSHSEEMLLIQSISFFFQVPIVAYFYSNYLTTDNVKRSAIIGIIINITITTIIALFFIGNAMMRALLNIGMYIIIAVFLYKDSLIKRIGAGFILFAFSLLSDVFCVFVITLVFSETDVTQLPSVLFAIILVIAYSFIFIMTKLFLTVFKYDISVHKKFVNLFALFCIALTDLCLLIGLSFVYNQLIYREAYNRQNYVALTALIIIYFIVIIAIWRYIHYLRIEINRNVMIQSTYNLYASQFNQYKDLKKENIEQMRYLRHDIMNYVQTLSTYHKEDKHD